MPSISSTKFERPFCIALSALALTGCVSLGPTPELYEAPELTSVPFFAQTEYDCGPAALATILNAAGVTVTPEELLGAVYVEGLEGSLQIELVAATRRYGRLPIPIPPDSESLLQEISSGRPVLVLQNQRLARLPAWHYAVVVGYLAADRRFVLRSGDQARRLERPGRFLRSWHLADNWGIVAVAPGDIPASATPDTYMRALVGAAQQLGSTDTERAYSAAVEAWPDDSLVLFLTASWQQSQTNLKTAERLYRRLLELEPAHTAARNNLANVLLERGCRADALREARLALRTRSPAGDFRADITDTIQAIESTPASSGVSCT